jgi:hypothetical protein
MDSASRRRRCRIIADVVFKYVLNLFLIDVFFGGYKDHKSATKAHGLKFATGEFPPEVGRIVGKRHPLMVTPT